MITGSIINALAILAGSAAGLLLKWAAGKFSGSLTGASSLGLRLQDIIMKGVALCVLYLGISGSLKGSNTLVAILSMVLGAIIGELLDLDRRMQALGDWVQKKTERLVRGTEGAPLCRRASSPPVYSSAWEPWLLSAHWKTA